MSLSCDGTCGAAASCCPKSDWSIGPTGMLTPSNNLRWFLAYWPVGKLSWFIEKAFCTGGFEPAFEKKKSESDCFLFCLAPPGWPNGVIKCWSYS